MEGLMEEEVERLICEAVEVEVEAVEVEMQLNAFERARVSDVDIAGW